jgi:ribosomal protein L10
MKNNNKKQVIICDIQSNFQQAKAVIFYNFHQVANEEIFHLKKDLKKTGSR